MIPGKLEAAVNDIRRLPNIVHVNMCDIRYLSGVFPPDLRYPRSYVNICSHVNFFHVNPMIWHLKTNSMQQFQAFCERYVVANKTVTEITKRQTDSRSRFFLHQF